jgi:hypothetical protein
MYQICVRGCLTERLAAALEGMTLHAGAVNTVLTGEVKDQSQLYGLLDRLRDLGLELINVQPQIEAGRATDEVFWTSSPERLVSLPAPGDTVLLGPRNYCDDNTRASSWCHTEEHRRPGSWAQITRVILIHG